MKTTYTTAALLLGLSAAAQEAPATTFADDSTAPRTKYLTEITVVGRNSKSDYQQLPEIVGTSIYAGKKNALIVLDNVQGNVVTNTMRQVLAKVPGIHVWESDASGVQIGIAARGLSPNRSWEFNVRQNGYDIAADPFGYPEAYYNPQLQAVQRIEVVRGQGSLQYGPQFGGMVNYILRNGSEITKPFEFETQQTFGSNRLFNSYNAVGGTSGKVHYYAFFDHRAGDGWRQNSRYLSDAGFGTVTYRLTKQFSLSAELMRSHIRSQQAGGLTDAQFAQNAQQSFRARNWMDITWTNPALTATWQLNENTRWTTKLSATIGDRNSVGFMPGAGIRVADTINKATLAYNNRVLNEDSYRNYVLESRFITDYRLGLMNNTVSFGVRGYTGNTHRLAEGKGTTGSDYDMSLAPGGRYDRDINFGSQNVAAFVENIFRINKKLLLIPGVRYEWLKGDASGRIGYKANGQDSLLQNVSRSRSFVLAGVGAEYHVTPLTEIYASYAQAYRPIQFANLQAPAAINYVVDQELKDSKGYNVDLGYRGKVRNFLQFDVSAFYLQYNNRIGNVTENGVTRVTNVGNSVSQGFEGYVEFNPVRAFTTSTTADLIVFGSYSYLDARYKQQSNKALENKRVENAPQDIFRGGITAGYKGFLITGQVSHVGATFSDANNTEAASANGQVGLIPSYTVTDLSASYKFGKGFTLKAGVNNLADKRYFTRRAGGYPGPGILPADGRTAFVSIGAKF
ncbi:TonB-dependent receptor [Flaviaesturariibacter amylovorans]|uniref:TonB-dependent receptor n=1 Tax=Flaviaesturariibacter amylovorans TaxID=1084520 RepID=A0ABP8G712_9BACT